MEWTKKRSVILYLKRFEELMSKQKSKTAIRIANSHIFHKTLQFLQTQLTPKNKLQSD